MIMSLTKDISKFLEKAFKTRDLSDKSKTSEDTKKREESSTRGLTDMTDMFLQKV